MGKLRFDIVSCQPFEHFCRVLNISLMLLIQRNDVSFRIEVLVFAFAVINRSHQISLRIRHIILIYIIFRNLLVAVQIFHTSVEDVRLIGKHLNLVLGNIACLTDQSLRNDLLRGDVIVSRHLPGDTASAVKYRELCSEVCGKITQGAPQILPVGLAPVLSISR